ncbi:hypothetical protein [Cupriavidus sp. PET2-C1]
MGRWQEDRSGGDRWHDTGGRTMLGSLESGIKASNALSVIRVLPYPPDSRFESEEARVQHNVRGVQLWKQLQQELGAGTSVDVYSTKLIRRAHGKERDKTELFNSLLKDFWHAF